MGKKIKRDENTSPPDKFDPAAIESKQSATVVLMLSSPEYDVQSQACEAIFNFVKKAEENQKQLVELGAVEALVKLLVSEEKEVRRNAVMALAMLTGHPDARRNMRKLEHSVSTLLSLLSQKEMVTTWEFTCLCLANMSLEYSAIASIVQNDGLPCLVAAIKMADPDVKKHGTACLSLLMQDADAQESIQQFGGLEALLNCLDSEFPIIQEQALLALIRSTNATTNQATLRHMDAFVSLVEILQKPELNDLHVLAVQVLANCSEEEENLKALKESGALMAFVGFITEPVESEEDGKPADKKKKGGSAKKGKKGDDDKKDEEKIPSQQNPVVKMHSCNGIGRLARLAENRKNLHDSEVEKKLIFLLGHDDESVRVAAVKALASMAVDSLCQDTIMKNEGLDPLLKLAKNEHEEPKQGGLLCLAHLTTGNMAVAQELATHHGLELLVSSLANENDRAVASAMKTLCNMACDDYLRNKTLTLGLLAAMTSPMNSSSATVLTGAAQVVASFFCDVETIALFRAKGLLEQLHTMLLDNHAEVLSSACWALSNLLVDPGIAEDIYEMGGLEILLNLSQSQTKNDRFVEAALGRLLNHNLSAKYAYTGVLTASDIIGSEFFDVGQLKPETKLLTLEEYFDEDINTKRAILSIYLAPEKPPPPEVTEEEGDEEKEEQLAEVPEVQETEEEAPTEPETSEFTPPDDCNLKKYVADCREMLFPMATTREQIVALATFVSERMGGAVNPSELMDFSYELPISELKFNIRSNVVPLGVVDAGIHYHRALLFKFLADHCGVSCTLERGEYNRAWNRVLLNIGEDGQPCYPPSNCMVDLMFVPGRLIPIDSEEALTYTRI